LQSTDIYYNSAGKLIVWRAFAGYLDILRR